MTMSPTRVRIVAVLLGIVLGVMASRVFGLAGFVVVLVLSFVCAPLYEARRDRGE